MIASSDNDCEPNFVVGLAYWMSGGLYLAGAGHWLLGAAIGGRQSHPGTSLACRADHEAVLAAALPTNYPMKEPS